MQQQLYKLRQDPPDFDAEFCSYPNTTPVPETEEGAHFVSLHYSPSQDDDHFESYPSVDLIQAVQKAGSSNVQQVLTESMSEHPEVLMAIEAVEDEIPKETQVGDSKLHSAGDCDMQMNVSDADMVENSVFEPEINLPAFDNEQSIGDFSKISTVPESNSQDSKHSFLVMDSQEPMGTFDYEPACLVPSTLPKEVVESSLDAIKIEQDTILIKDSQDENSIRSQLAKPMIADDIQVAGVEQTNETNEIPTAEIGDNLGQDSIMSIIDDSAIEDDNAQQKATTNFKAPICGDRVLDEIAQSNPKGERKISEMNDGSQLLEATQPIGSINPEIAHLESNDADILLLREMIENPREIIEISSSQTPQENLAQAESSPLKVATIAPEEVPGADRQDSQASSSAKQLDARIVVSIFEENSIVSENPLSSSQREYLPRVDENIQSLDTNLSSSQLASIPKPEDQGDHRPKSGEADIVLQSQDLADFGDSDDENEDPNSAHNPQKRDIENSKVNSTSNMDEIDTQTSALFGVTGRRLSALKRKAAVIDDSSSSSASDNSNDDDYEPTQRIPSQKKVVQKQSKTTSKSSTPKSNQKLKPKSSIKSPSKPIQYWRLVKDNHYELATGPFEDGKIPENHSKVDVRCGQKYLERKTNKTIIIEEIVVPNQVFRIKRKRGQLVKISISDLIYNPELDIEPFSMEFTPQRTELDLSNFGILISISNASNEGQERWFADKEFVKTKISQIGGRVYNAIGHIYDKRDRKHPTPKEIILLSHKPLRTKKFLGALALGIPIISTLWIRDCYEKV